MIRKPIFAANWKMNNGASDTEDFFKSFLSKIQGATIAADIVIAPPFISLPKLADLLHHSDPGQNAHAIQMAAQNCSEYDSGAYTGEISVLMLREFFVHYVILGHSERRAIFGESDATINAKVKKAREANLKPIFCIGETLAERENGKLEAHVFVRSVISDLYGADAAAKIRILYGGSVKPGNTAELMACPDIDGALIGGAALDPQSFYEIICNGSGE
jgi:triosephosphate isomerase (TIM)